MPPARSDIRDLVHTYLERHPAERAGLERLLVSLDAAVDPTSRATLPGHITCSAVVIDRDRRVLHIHHRAGGLALAPGGHVETADRTLLAAALREVHEKAGIKPGDLCLTPQLLGSPIDIDVHDIDANPAKGEPAHQHYDVRFAFYLAHEKPEIALQDEEVPGAEWRPFDQVSSPTLRAKLLDSALDGQPEPVNASALIFDDSGRYLLHLRDHYPGIWEPGAFALLAAAASHRTSHWRRRSGASSVRKPASTSRSWNPSPRRRPPAPTACVCRSRSSPAAGPAIPTPWI